MENSEQPISDPHITSSMEIEEERMEAERTTVAQVVQQIQNLAEQTTETDENIVRETNNMKEEIDRNEILIRTCAAAEAILVEQTKEEINHIKQIHQALSEEVPYMQSLERVLKHKRMENQAILQADPIFALIQEEARLKQQLEELGVHVPPPRP